MAFVLRKNNYYCYLDSNRTVLETQSIKLATKFNTEEKARAMLNKATRKLKNYRIVDLETMQEIEGVHKIKRRQFSRTERMVIYNNSKGRCAICGRFVPYDSSQLIILYL